MLNKDKVQALKEKIQTEHDQHMANANAAKGALQVLEHLLEMPDDDPKCCQSEVCPTVEE